MMDLDMSTIWGSFRARCRCGAGIEYEINISQDDLPMLSEPLDLQAAWDEASYDEYEWGVLMGELGAEADEAIHGAFTFGEMEEALTQEANEQPEDHQSDNAQPQGEQVETEETEVGQPEA